LHEVGIEARSLVGGIEVWRASAPEPAGHRKQAGSR